MDAALAEAVDCDGLPAFPLSGWLEFPPGFELPGLSGRPTEEEDVGAIPLPLLFPPALPEFGLPALPSLELEDGLPVALELELVLLWPPALELPPALLFALGLAARAVPVKNIESAKTVAVRLRFLFIFYSLLNFLNCLN
jgi:hypothetical protein